MHLHRDPGGSRAVSRLRARALARLAGVALATCLLQACSSGTSAPSDPVTGLAADLPVLLSTDNGARLYYAAPASAEVEIRLDRPSGPLVARLPGGRGHAATGPWIRDGMRLHLQDVTDGRPLASRHTLATAVATVDAGTPGRPGTAFGATPGVVPDPQDTGRGATTLHWSAPDASEVQVRTGAPDGPLLASGPAVGWLHTGPTIADGTRFYLQDASADDPGSGAATLAVATVDLQPARQRYIAFWTPDEGVLVHSRDSMHRLGAIPPQALPPGTTALDMQPGPDGERLYLLGSDLRYHVLDPASATVTGSFPVGSGSRSFGVMRGPTGRPLLVAAPDAQGVVTIVDPADGTLVARLACDCRDSVSGILIDPLRGVPHFVSKAPSDPPLPLPPPQILPSGLTLHSVTSDLRMGTPFPLPLPDWGPGARSELSEARFVFLNAGASGTVLATWWRFPMASRPPPRPADVTAHDIALRTTTTLAASFRVDAAPDPRVAVPQLASPDGLQVYAQPQATIRDAYGYVHGVAPDGLLRFAAEPGAAPPRFAPAAELARSDARTVLTPPLALDERFVFFGQVDIVGSGASETPTRPTGPFFLHRADRATLAPVGPPRLVVHATPEFAARTPLTGLSLGSYAWSPREATGR